MRLEQVVMYKFFFGYEGTELMIPIAANSESSARSKLRGLLLQWSNDLEVVSGAVLSPVQQKETPMPTMKNGPGPAVPTTPILELRIEELLKTIVDKRLRAPKGTVAATVKEWTGFKHEPENYPAILEELEKIKHG